MDRSQKTNVGSGVLILAPRAALVVVAVALMIAMAPSLFAAEGRIPIPFTSPIVTPINITQPGSYIVTRNLKQTGLGPVINVTVGAGIGLSEVDLDLNGFTLDATAFGGGPAIRVSVGAGSTAEVTIRNGAITGGTNAILVVGALGAPVRKVVIERVRASNTTGDAIVLSDPQNIVIRNNVIVDVTPPGPGAAISIPVGTGVVKQVTIEGNLIRNTKDGINILSAAASPATVAILNNRLELIVGGGATGAAIHLDQCAGCLLMENTIRDVLGGPGIRLVNSSGGKLFDNVIFRTTAEGISLTTFADDNLLLRNVIKTAGLSAIYVAGDRNQIEGNLINSSGRGLTIDVGTATGNLYRHNTARGNTGAAACPGGLCSLDFCGFSPGLGNTTQGDNWLPALGAAPPACEK